MSVADVGGVRRTEVPWAAIVLSVVAMVVAVPFGAVAVLSASAVAFVSLGVALRDMVAPVFTWASGIVAFVYVVWLIPIKGYTLPVSLPFNLEHYRLLLLFLVVVFVYAVATHRMTVNAAGSGWALLALAAIALVSAILNLHAITASSGSGVALKSLSYFLSFLVVFVLVASVIRTKEQMDAVVRALVVGGVIVAVSALYETRSGYNVFDHLNQFLPGLKRLPRDVLELRAGQVRVYASAQHPIALGAALLLVTPLALYLSGQARNMFRSILWLVGGVIILTAATATISRTIVVMGVAMVIVALLLRGVRLKRFWPVLLLLPVVIHFVAPGTMGGLYQAFGQTPALANDPRAGLAGSGRLSDLTPGFKLWLQEPMFGQGLGRELPTFDNIYQTPGRTQVPLIFDNQYLSTLVYMGMLGLCATLVFVWGSSIRLYRAAKRATGPPADLLAACTASVVGFAASMFLFDAFSFVQCSLIFFAIAALGLRLAALTQEESAVVPGSVG